MAKRMPELIEKHCAATIYLVSQERPKKVLLLHHKKFDTWLPPGGHREIDENHYEAAIRETLEETGIDVSDYLPKPERLDERAVSLPCPDYISEERIDPHGDCPEHFHLNMVYLVEIPIQEAECQECESHDIGWFSVDEVKSLPMFENVKIFVDKIFSK